MPTTAESRRSSFSVICKIELIIQVVALKGLLFTASSAIPRGPADGDYTGSQKLDRIAMRFETDMGHVLRDKVNAQLKEAMKSKDKRRISTLRLINAAFKDRDIQARGTGKDDAPTEADLQAILSKLIKQRRDSAETYEQGGRPELAEGEREEIVIIEEFLPRQLSEEETRAAVQQVLDEEGLEGLKDMGKAMAALKSKHAGQMDFAKASGMVKQMLS